MRLVLFGIMVSIALVFSASAQTLCPDGSYVSSGPCLLCPDGGYVGGGGQTEGSTGLEKRAGTVDPGRFIEVDGQEPTGLILEQHG